MSFCLLTLLKEEEKNSVQFSAFEEIRSSPSLKLLFVRC